MSTGPSQFYSLATICVLYLTVAVKSMPTAGTSKSTENSCALAVLYEYEFSSGCSNDYASTCKHIIINQVIFFPDNPCLPECNSTSVCENGQCIR